MTNQHGRRQYNSGSKLLTKDENEKLFQCLSKRSVSQTAAVVQVYESYPSPSQWSKKCCGVACFVKDNEKRSFFIRVYDIWEQKVLWEHEIYNNLKYESQCSFFHYFASNEYWVALNFANEEESENFKNVVLEKLEKKNQRREQRRRQAPAAPGGEPSRSRTQRQPPPSGSAPPSQAPAPAPSTKKEKKGKKESKKLTKADISRPTNFLHVGHVGWDPTGNWQVGEEDELKTWCKNLGIDEDSLKDMATVNFIKGFIDQNGGIAAIQQEALPPPTSRSTRTGNLPPPPPPNRELPPPPMRNVPLPPTPTRTNNRGPAPPPPPPSGRTRPGGGRPPPPAAPMSTPPPPPPSRPMSSSLPPPPPAPALHSNGPPPPPPPPPMMGGGGGGPPPPPPPPPSNAPSSGGARAGLLSDIRSGTSLKTVDHDEQSEGTPTGRNALLEAIRGGRELKKVEAVEKDESSGDMGGLGSALLSALSQRSVAIHDPDERDSDEEEFDEDDDDWDD